MADLVSGNLPPVSLHEQISCIERELALRRRVYSGLVERGRMRQAAADEEIRRMEAVLDTLRRLERKQ